MEADPQERVYCSDLSLQADEPLIASATLTTHFLLLEYNGAWGEKAFEDSDLSDAVKEHLNIYARSQAHCKTLLIRSQRSLAEPGVRFFAARLSETGGEVYDFHFNRYDELLDIDLQSLFGGALKYAAHRRSAPLYLVCTHGRRDRCCARAGISVYAGLIEAARAADREMGVWQCSHVGGHRFAANLICLSSGLLYGRVRSEDVRAILEAERRRELRLESLRGRLCYPPAAQAAEAAVHRQTGELRLDAYHLEALEEEGPGSWAVKFSGDGKSFRVDVHAQKTGARVYESCTLDKMTSVVAYHCTIQLEDSGYG